jgi:purine-nucleoside phosphorylase
MSTVPEAIVARHCGLQILAISCITNLAAGILDAPLSHAEVLETTNRVRADFTKVLDLALEKVL